MVINIYTVTGVKCLLVCRAWKKVIRKLSYHSKPVEYSKAIHVAFPPGRPIRVVSPNRNWQVVLPTNCSCWVTRFPWLELNRRNYSQFSWTSPYKAKYLLFFCKNSLSVPYITLLMAQWTDMEAEKITHWAHVGAWPPYLRLIRGYWFVESHPESQ